MKIVEKNIDELVPYENNPRNNSKAVDYVAKSIGEFGFKVPIIIDKDNVIVAGHTRHLAAKKLGLESVPCVIADDLTDEQIKAYRLADNKVSEFATWDIELLSEELSDIIELDMSDFGFIDLGEDVNLDDFFEDKEEIKKEKEEKEIQCPHCKMFFKV